MEDDPLYLASVDVMRERPEDAGICALQRGLLIGYNRASRLMDCMIERGIVVRTYDAENGVRYTVPNAALRPRAEGESSLEGTVMQPTEE